MHPRTPRRARRRLRHLRAGGRGARSPLWLDSTDVQHAHRELPAHRRHRGRPRPARRRGRPARTAPPRHVRRHPHQRDHPRPAVLRGAVGTSDHRRGDHGDARRGRLLGQRSQDLRLTVGVGGNARRGVPGPGRRSGAAHGRPCWVRRAHDHRRLGPARDAGHHLAQPGVRRRVRAGGERVDPPGDVRPGGGPMAVLLHDVVVRLPRGGPGDRRLHPVLPARRCRRLVARRPPAEAGGVGRHERSLRAGAGADPSGPRPRGSRPRAGGRQGGLGLDGDDDGDRARPRRAGHPGLRRPLDPAALPLERLYRDARCGATMLPWSVEVCLERLGRFELDDEETTWA